MRKKSTDTQEETEFEDSVVMGITPDGNGLYLHTFDDDIIALEFMEVMIAGFRAEVLSELRKRQAN